MTQVVTPSENTITAGQIGKLQDILGAALRKSGLMSEPTQEVIETQGESLVAELVAAVRKRVEAVSNMIVRLVSVNRSRTPQETLDATGRRQYTDRNVVDAMPKGEGDEATVYFFNLGRYVSDEELEKEYELRGLKPADPYSLAAVNEEDPSFADTHPNGTHWHDANGKWCFAAFDHWRGERGVFVSRSGRGWHGSWWFAGVRK
ncbi:MAG: hypothetical protein NUV78_00175 [Candidatus Zambryskibacteria bacterium]|nr:hypothetical protein [Candidatus Zambryskibacteria bacterium]